MITLREYRSEDQKTLLEICADSIGISFDKQKLGNFILGEFFKAPEYIQIAEENKKNIGFICATSKITTIFENRLELIIDTVLKHLRDKHELDNKDFAEWFVNKAYWEIPKAPEKGAKFTVFTDNNYAGELLIEDYLKDMSIKLVMSKVDFIYTRYLSQSSKLKPFLANHGFFVHEVKETTLKQSSYLIIAARKIESKYNGIRG